MSKWYDNKELLVMKYIEQGAAVADLSVLFGVTEQTVRNLLRKYGIKRG